MYSDTSPPSDEPPIAGVSGVRQGAEARINEGFDDADDERRVYIGLAAAAPAIVRVRVLVDAIDAAVVDAGDDQRLDRARLDQRRRRSRATRQGSPPNARAGSNRF